MAEQDEITLQVEPLDEATPKAPSLEALEAVHTFPTPFVIKAVGQNSKRFANDVEARVRAAIQPTTPVFTRRASRNGTYQAITIQFRASTPQQVQAVFVELHDVPGLRMLM